QVFNCRGCHAAGGGAIDLEMFLAGCDFVRACETLAGSPAPKSEPKPRQTFRAPLGPIVATYDYTDENGPLLYQVTRHQPKDFRQRKPDPHNPDGGWISNIDDVRLVPYRLPELVEAVGMGVPVFVVEGEKDADTGARLGVIATTNVMGAGKWHSRGADYAP